MNEITSFIDSLDLGFEPTREGSGYIISSGNGETFGKIISFWKNFKKR